MGITYGSNFKGKKLGKSNQSAIPAPVTPATPVLNDLDPKNLGAAGRGSYGAEAVAQLQVAAKNNQPLSTAETVSTKSNAYKKALKATSSSLPKMAGVSAPNIRTRATDRTVAGKTANSAGAFYGAAGRDTMATDAAGNGIYDTMGGRNIIGGKTSVDRTAGIPQDPMSQYMAMLSPQSVIDRQKQARQELERERQSQLDGIRQKYSSQVATEQAAGAEDMARQRSMNLRAGLGGSDFGIANKAEVRNKTNANVRAIQANQDIELGNVLNSIEQMAQSRVQQEQQAIQQGFADTMQYQQYSQQQQAQNRAQAVESISQLGKAGLDIATIKQRDPQLYENLTQASGMGQVELEAVLNNSKPPAAKIDYQTIVRGGKIMMFGVDPSTGTMKMLEQEVDMPDNYKTLQADDGTILGIPENWDGDTSKIVSVGNYRKPFASEMGGGGNGSMSNDVSTQLYAGLSSPTATAVRGKVTKFSSEPIVQNFATIQEGYNFATSIPDTTVNPADDQALIYSLAKALDPGSVVREGEYATAQKYSQSWINAYGKGVEQALVGTGFLSEQARKNIKQTIEQKYTASKKSYDNLYNNYEKSINSLTGRGDGASFLVDYATANTLSGSVDPDIQTAQSASIGDVVTIAGKKYKKLGEDNYEEIQPISKSQIRNSVLFPISGGY